MADLVPQFDRDGESLVALRAANYKAADLSLLVFEIKFCIGPRDVWNEPGNWIDVNPVMMYQADLVVSVERQRPVFGVEVVDNAQRVASFEQ